MANIMETILSFQNVCNEEGLQPTPFIMTVLNKEKESALIEPKDQMLLYLAGNNKLVTNSRVSDSDTPILYKWLSTNYYVTSIDLRYNNITDEGIVHIAKLVEESGTLRELNVMCNDFEEVGAQHLAKALHKNESLTSLRLNGNKIGNQGGMYFAQALQINISLEALDLGDTDLKTESVIALATVLNQNRTLKTLNVNRPLLFTHQEEPSVHYANMLKVNRGLKELHMMKYDMRDFGVTRLAENLTDNFYLTHLNLSCNRITRDGAKELAKLLKRNTPLQLLDLSFNRLEDDGAMYLADALSGQNSTLETLVLKNNNINGKGLCAIADCMKMNIALNKVYIWGNNLEESACIAYASLLDTGRLDPNNTDVEAYIVDGVTILSELSNGPRQWYYWAPSYGPQAVKELAQFT